MKKRSKTRDIKWILLILIIPVCIYLLNNRPKQPVCYDYRLEIEQAFKDGYFKGIDAVNQLNIGKIDSIDFAADSMFYSRLCQSE